MNLMSCFLQDLMVLWWRRLNGIMVWSECVLHEQSPGADRQFQTVWALAVYSAGTGRILQKKSIYPRIHDQEQERPLGQRNTPPAKKLPFCDILIKVVMLLQVNISIPCKFPSTQNSSDLDFDLPGSLKVKSDDVIGLAIYGSLFMIN